MDFTDEPEPDRPTVASDLIRAPTQAQPNVQPSGPRNSPTPAQQEPLILGPVEDDYAPDEQIANETTRMAGSQTSGMSPGQSAPYHPAAGPSYPGYSAQDQGYYGQQGGAYPGYAAEGGMGYGRATDDEYEMLRAVAARNRTGRIVGLLLILLGLLLIIGAMVLYVVGHKASGATLTLPQEALLVIQQPLLWLV